MKDNDNSNFRREVLNYSECDILALCETFLKNGEKIETDGFKWFGHNRQTIHRRANRGSGGVGFLVRNELLENFNVTTLDTSHEGIMWLRITSKLGDFSLCCAVCYLPPHDSCRAMDSSIFFDKLMEQLYTYQNMGKIILMGDYNARCGQNSDYIEGVDTVPPRDILDETENHHGDNLISFLTDVNFCMLNGRFRDREWTHVSPVGKSVVDYMCVPYEQLEHIKSFTIMKMSDIIDNIRVHPNSIPDHSFLKCELTIPDAVTEKSSSISEVGNEVTAKYNSKNTPNDFLVNESVLEQVNTSLIKIEHSVTVEKDIQRAYDEFALLIKREMDQQLQPIKTFKASKGRSKYKPYWNDELTLLWNESRNSEHEWLKFTGAPMVKSRLKAKFCADRKQFDKAHRKYKRQYQQMERLNIQGQLQNHNQTEFWRSIGKVGMANERRLDIPWEVVDHEGHVQRDKKAVLCRWKSDFEGLFNANGVTHNLPPAQTVDAPNTDDLNLPIDRTEIIKAIDAAKYGKASGIDQIPAEVLKNDSAVELMLRMCNGCFELGYVPTEWTRGIINPIYKHILALHSMVNTRKLAKQSTYVSFIDLRKAFDTVDRTLLWYKLERIGLRGKFHMALQSLYRDVKCCVRVNGNNTPWFDVTSGVKQGCVLSPTMFSVFINDLATRINEAGLGVSVDDTIISILLYADDIALIAPDPKSLQSMLDIVSDWCRMWGLAINPQKSKVVHFRPPSIQQTDFEFKCGLNDIDKTDSYKYLGLWFDEHLRMDKVVKELAKSASRALGALIGKFISVGGMTYDVFTKLYETVVEPVLMYCSGVWGTKQYSVINTVQNKAIRFFMAVGKHTSNIALRGDMGWNSCFSKQRRASIRLMCRVVRTDDGRLFSRIVRWSSRYRRGWHGTITKLISDMDETNLVNDRTVSTKTVIRRLSDKLNDLDLQDWHRALYDDRNCVNGNKLRTYRTFKQSINPEAYVTSDIPRTHRRVLAQFRAGCLPIAIETGRYSRPTIPLEERKCLFCTQDVIEDEKHFLIHCNLYDDLRSELYNACSSFIYDFENLNSDRKFSSIMTCPYIHENLSKYIFKAFYRRKIFR